GDLVKRRARQIAGRHLARRRAQRGQRPHRGSAGIGRAAYRGFARRAPGWLAAVLKGQPVFLEFEPGREDFHDRQGRTPAYLYTARLLDPSAPSDEHPQSNSVNEMVLRAGYGFIDPDDSFRRGDRFRRREQEARSEKRGLWGDLS